MLVFLSMKPAYSPIDIATPTIELEKLDRYMQARGEKHYTGCWYEAPLCGRVNHEDQLLQSHFRDQAWGRRMDPPGSSKVVWSSLCQELFPEIRETLLRLPFVEITYCNLLLQIKSVPVHLDLDHRYNEQARTTMEAEEPASYKWLLSGTHLKSFYMQKSPDTPETQRHIQLPPGHSIFAIAEKEAYHGADYFPEERKYILSIFGVLDAPLHSALIAESIKKFSPFTIFY